MLVCGPSPCIHSYHDPKKTWLHSRNRYHKQHPGLHVGEALTLQLGAATATNGRYSLKRLRAVVVTAGDDEGKNNNSNQ